MNGIKFFCSSFLSLLVCCLLFVNQATAAPVQKNTGAKKHAAKISKKRHVSHRIAVRHKHKPSKAGPSHLATRSTPQDSRINNALTAKSAIIIDAATGKTLFARSPDIHRQPASTIKILTGMIALKTLSDRDAVSVSFKAAQQPRSKVFLDQNREYNANDLINAVLLASANDASVALAEKIAGSEQSFAQKMTNFAHQWGASQTVCKTATGLTAQGQETTARDLATIFRHAMENPEFAARMKQINVNTEDGKVLHSHNRALWQVPGSEGGKTGYTDVARQTYVGKFRRGNDEIIVAIMGSETMWGDLKKLVEFGFTKKNSHQVATTSGSTLKIVSTPEALTGGT